jgi:hypothetical protein
LSFSSGSSSDSYTENLSDILKVQDEVAEAVAQKLLLNLPPLPAGALAASVDPEGYISYMRGRRAWTNRDLARSVSAFEDSVALRPRQHSDVLRLGFSSGRKRTA